MHVCLGLRLCRKRTYDSLPKHRLVPLFVPDKQWVVPWRYEKSTCCVLKYPFWEGFNITCSTDIPGIYHDNDD